MLVRKTLSLQTVDRELANQCIYTHGIENLLS